MTAIVRSARLAAAAATCLLIFGGGTRILKLAGATAPPRVLLTGPAGQRVTTPADGRPLTNGQFVVLEDRETNTTNIAIRRASRTWHVTPSAGPWCATWRWLSPRPSR
jgi:hypothetical protein